MELNVRLQGKELVGCQLLSKSGNEQEKRVGNQGWCKGQESKSETSSFVGVGDADLLTNAQSVAVQAGVKIQHVIETATVGFGNLPTCVPGLDVIIGAALRTGLRRRLRVYGSDQPED